MIYLEASSEGNQSETRQNSGSDKNGILGPQSPYVCLEQISAVCDEKNSIGVNILSNGVVWPWYIKISRVNGRFPAKILANSGNKCDRVKRCWLLQLDKIQILQETKSWKFWNIIDSPHYFNTIKNIQIHLKHAVHARQTKMIHKQGKKGNK